MSYKTMSIRKPTWNPSLAIEAVAAQRKRCEKGDHNTMEAKAAKVTYVDRLSGRRCRGTKRTWADTTVSRIGKSRGDPTDTGEAGK